MNTSKFFLVTLLTLSAINFSVPFAANKIVAITDVRYWSAPDHTRVVLDLSAPVKYEISSKESKDEFVVELTETSLQTKKKSVEINDRFVRGVAATDLGKGRIRLRILQKKPLLVSVHYLKPYLDKPHRLVIDLLDPVEEKKEQEERLKERESRLAGAKTVVIDPGHGGEDPGAIGPSGTKEKEIVLMVAEKVVQRLRKKPGIKAFLTRKGDYFVALEERTKIAREYGADLFISLHTDGSFNRNARGSSVYCLSLSGATDEAARVLADKENMSNILGGALLRPASLAKDPNLSQILFDLMQSNSMRESIRFAEILLPEVKKINHLKYGTYRQANFVVLRAPDIPSVLFEMAFITNKHDEQLLNQDSFQEKIATAIAEAVLQFLR